MRITLLGNKSGKTSIIQRWLGSPIHPENTIAIDMKTISYQIDGVVEILHVWDCSGKTHYNQMYDSYLDNSDIIVIVFDLTSLESWKVAQYWITRSKLSSTTPVCLIGNKLDLESTRRIKRREVKLFLRQINRPFVFYTETSALTGENCKSTLNMIVREGKRNQTDVVYTQNDLAGRRSDVGCTIV